MKVFTVKDFIKYNGPCKVCNSKIEFRLKYFDQPYSAQSPIILKPTIENNTLNFNLVIKYKNNLLFSIDPKTNKFSIQSINPGAWTLFKEFIDAHDMYVELLCLGCGTSVGSDFIIFEDNKIKPLKLFSELIYVDTSSHSFRIYTSFTKNTSVISADIVGAPARNTLNLELPIVPFSKFKDKDALVKKLKMLLTFS